jgi:RNA polymerase sigma factor (TIGR02999 family)
LDDIEFDDFVRRVREADQPTIDALFSDLYEAIRREARRLIKLERPGHTLQATDLVSEAYLRLRELKGVDWQDRAHFLRTVARAMRRALVDLARRRKAKKRAGLDQLTYVTLGVRKVLALEDLITLEDALEKLSVGSGNLPREALVLEMTFFAGATKAEIAQSLDITERQVYRDYAHARVWLRREFAL